MLKVSVETVPLVDLGLHSCCRTGLNAANELVGRLLRSRGLHGQLVELIGYLSGRRRIRLGKMSKGTSWALESCDNVGVALHTDIVQRLVGHVHERAVLLVEDLLLFLIDHR